MASVKGEATIAAIRHFPERAKDIEMLVRDSESFRDLCDELAEAEEALATVEGLEIATRAQRRLEWLSFIRGTLAEISAELRRVKVVSIDRSRRHQ